MPLPSDINLITLTTGNGWVDATGQLVNGSMTFTMPGDVNDLIADQLIVAKDVTASLVNGELYSSGGLGPMQILPSNHPDMVQNDWTYHVTENFSGIGKNRAPYDIVIPYDAPGGVYDLTQIIQGIPASNGTTQLVSGPQGPEGPQGPPGAGYAYMTYRPSAPSAEWVIDHTLGRLPQVQIIDLAGKLQMAGVENVDGTVTITFAAPFDGYALLG
jgi:hypothetical protein